MSLDKRKRTVLTIEQKANIIMRLRRGEPMRNIIDEFKIGKSTVYDLKRDADKILHFAAESDSMAGPSHRRTMKKSQLNDLDEAVYQWFSQRRSSGLPISSTLIMDKAMQLYRAMNIDKPFTASSGWLKRFKSRHGIRQSSDENLHVDNSAKERYREEFKKIMEEKTSSKQMNNSEEAYGFWQNVLSKALACCQEKPRSWKEIQDCNVCDRSWSSSRDNEDCSDSFCDGHPIVKEEVTEDMVNSEVETDCINGTKNKSDCSDSLPDGNPLVKLEISKDMVNGEFEADYIIGTKNKSGNHLESSIQSEQSELNQNSGKPSSIEEENYENVSNNLSNAVYHATKLLKFLEKQAKFDPVPYLQVVKIRNSILQQRAKHLNVKEQTYG